MTLSGAGDEVDAGFRRTDPRGASYENVFGGAPSFLRRRYTRDLDGFDVAVTGVPFDQAVTHRPGSRFGPRAIREASLLQAGDPPFGWPYDVLSEFAIADYGDMAFDYAKVHEVPARIEAHVGGILDAGCGAIVLGGDHFVTLPNLRAAAARHGPVALVHFDAHSDLWPDDDPERIDHGTFLYKAVKEGLVLPDASIQVGIRTTTPDQMGVHVVHAPDVHRQGPAEVAERVLSVVGERPCWITFDIDCLDPAFAPGTGTPVWGGLATWQAAMILRDLAGLRLIGGDVVEVAPAYDTTGATAIAGAHVAVELLSLWGWTRRG
jgi:agmatinase